MALLSGVIDWSLRHRAVVLVLTALLVLVGVRAALHLPIDAVPDLTNVQVQVLTSAPALSPVEIEQLVTIPVERALAGLPGAVQVRSISKYGISAVTVVFTDETDRYRARQLVAERLREAEAMVPPAYGRPMLGPISSALGEVFQFVVRGTDQSLMELEETLDWYIAPQLRSVPGVVEVNSLGGQERQYQVLLEPGRLQALGLSVREVVTALERSNANAGGGYVEYNREQVVLGSAGLVHNLSDLSTVVVGATPQGVPITIGHLGEVRFGPRLRRGAASMDGQGEVVVGVALMLAGANARTVTAAIRRRLAEIAPSLPPGVRVEPFYDRAQLVERTIRTALMNLAEGAALVVLVLLLLLGDVRAGLIVATTIPLSMLFAMAVMEALGASGNLMSLGAIDFGLIVDGSVIVTENAVRRLGAAGAVTAQERLQIVREAAMEVRAPAVFGELIIAVVYLPILTLTGIEGKLFMPMARTVLLALGGAFLLSLTLIPVLCSLLLQPGRQVEPPLLRLAGRLYAPLLAASLRRRALTLSVGLVVLAAAAVLATRLGAEFVPQLDEGDLLVEVRRLPGVALSESVATDLRMQRALLALPEVVHAISKTGSPEVATDYMGIEQSDVYLALRPRSAWRPGLTRQALAAEVAQALERAVPEAAVALSQPIQMRTNELLAGIRSDVAAMVYGPDLDRLREIGDQVGEAVRGVRGAVDVRVEQVAGLSYLRVRPDRARLARYGLTVEDVNQLVQTLSVGYPAGVVFEGERRFALVVRMAAPFDGTVESYRALPLRSQTGQMVPLSDVAELSIERGPVAVNRERQSRRLVVEFNVRGRDLVSVVEEARRKVAGAVPLPPGYRIEWGGQFEHYLEARQRLMWVVPVALGLIGLLLWLALGAARPVVIIAINVPFAAVGGIVALWLRGIPFSISAGVGFVALFGVAVLNGLVLVSFARRLEAEGMPTGQAVVRAAELRLRPVLTTALVASLGLLPMALSRAPGSEVQRPLATVVIGGLVGATALTLLLLPALATSRLGGLYHQKNHGASLDAPPLG
ncbi:MAG: CusA/CzcA family heavy metal efflux RND transporter [Myxococcales bacterium]|nr:CusA/CzcA family heavy metal efflux RND transporter [Myxococcota bacterium]MDW8282248.1 CusA/CzcA family heavy metal efflux RND transporter [Myxococcales bacterium]